MIHSELASASSEVSPHAVMPWPPRMQPTRLRVLLLDLGDVEAELEARTSPRHPHDLVAEDRRGQLLAVRGGRDRDAGVGVQVVDVGGVHEAVHGGVDRRRGAALAVQAVVERCHHLVLALDAGVDVDERAHPVQAQDRQAGLGEGAEVTSGALDPQELDRLAGDGVGLRAGGRGVASRVVGVLGVGTEAVGPGDQLGCCGVGHGSFWSGSGAGSGCGGRGPRSRTAASRRPGSPRSAAGSRTRRRRASGRPAGRAPRARRRARGVRRSGRRP